MQLVSILIPCYNEGNNIVLLYNELEIVVRSYPDINFEYVFVDDGSKDNTVEKIQKLTLEDNRVKLIQLSRNFGKEIALTAGIHHVNSDALIIMDSDLQHPPKVIHEFIKHWRSGYEIVATKRQEIENRSFVKRLGSNLFYHLMAFSSETEMVAGSTDFRLLDKKVVDELKKFTERNRLVRGMIDWVGFKKVYVEFCAPDRIHGEAGYTLKKLFGLAINSLTSFSLLPLKLASLLGIIISLSSGFLLAWMVVDKYFLNMQNFSPLSYVIVINTFLIGLVLISLGFIALYIGNIHTEAINRPLYIIRDKINIKRDNDEE
ncbi:glycosyltransferase [Vibrio cholerae]|nr:putative glycosyltransferase [Vibrio cholerae]GHX09797.1 glycosyltransferase [Vibrio cholerae]